LSRAERSDEQIEGLNENGVESAGVCSDAQFEPNIVSVATFSGRHHWLQYLPIRIDPSSNGFECFIVTVVQSVVTQLFIGPRFE
jgi:hypothetical protein